MKLGLILGLVSSVLPCSMKADPVDLNRLLEAICEVEGGAANEPGGRPCISYMAWSDRTDLAYQLSSNEASATPVFKAHLVWIGQQLTKAKLPITPARLASAWRWGFEGAKRRNFKCTYSQRVANLYFDTKGFKP